MGIVLVERPQSLGDDLDRFTETDPGRSQAEADRAGVEAMAGRRLGVKEVAQILGQVPRVLYRSDARFAAF